ncbi:WD40 repeat-like protein [Dacryopinax primogenitus]|uniref:WD40 repeat-like protein n=1 Tax=Dacryopinax primogenitus (strain DJM 731) TaxID=1858805 RepID=M5GFG2_DACPD|nr:WD40 repeat-like protein [Dacryopinax primogenitus]EJU06257.1 WD40 repeat-like protein [Dacryopinax primogenitus]
MTRTEHTLHPLQAFPVYSLAFVSDSRLVVGGGGGASRSGIKNKLRLYEVDSANLGLKQLSELELETGEDVPMTISAPLAGDPHIVCGINSAAARILEGGNENCRVYDTEGDEVKYDRARGTITGNDSEIYQKVTTFSPDRKMVAVGSTDNTVAVLTYPGLEDVCELLKVQDGELYDVSISEQHVLLTASSHLELYPLPRNEKEKGKAKLELTKRIERPTLSRTKPDKVVFRAARFSPSQPDRLFTVLNPSGGARSKSRGAKEPTSSYICRWDMNTWSVTRSHRVDNRPVTVFDVSADGNLLAWGSSDLKIGVLDAKTLSPLLQILKAHEFPPTALKFSPDARLLVSGSADNSLRLVHVPSGRPSSTFPTTTVVLIILLAILLAFLIQQYR